jgi:hypothetical protein
MAVTRLRRLAKGVSSEVLAQRGVQKYILVVRMLSRAWAFLATFYINYLIMNHCFIDGNKRAAWTACIQVLRMLGLTVSATDDEVEQLCSSIIDRSIANAVDVVGWLAPRLLALPV